MIALKITRGLTILVREPYCPSAYSHETRVSAFSYAYWRSLAIASPSRKANRCLRLSTARLSGLYG